MKLTLDITTIDLDHEHGTLDITAWCAPTVSGRLDVVVPSYSFVLSARGISIYGPKPGEPIWVIDMSKELHPGDTLTLIPDGKIWFHP